uniref:protein-tyrosine-phosphatase n=1 Tax=Globisporangium ultimum (strain ATCC 200006 / CBS 805.95 / DAOM BR144) TaxID=431595 RepID=K3WB15_GLOUD
MTTMHAEQQPQEHTYGGDDRLDVPGVIEDNLLMGSVKHARDEQLLKEHLQISYLLDAENPRKRSASGESAAAAAAVAAAVVDPTIDTGRVELDDDFSYESFKSSVTHANQLIQKALQDQKTVFVFCTHGNNESAVVCITYLMLTKKWTLERAYKHRALRVGPTWKSYDFWSSSFTVA